MSSNTATGKSNLVPIITMMFLFAMISFVTNMAAPFGNIWGNQYPWAGMLGNLMNFAAYLFMGIPAGKMLARVGYKKPLCWLSCSASSASECSISAACSAATSPCSPPV